mmetsp:Transcript_4458/g.11333  ORF Transcript_4458/g.11333 Transcript_4458/m.11333 type:complete len:207 (+) Transcript_4458:532-1152(+)
MPSSFGPTSPEGTNRWPTSRRERTSERARCGALPSSGGCSHICTLRACAETSTPASGNLMRAPTAGPKGSDMLRSFLRRPAFIGWSGREESDSTSTRTSARTPWDRVRSELSAGKAIATPSRCCNAWDTAHRHFVAPQSEHSCASSRADAAFRLAFTPKLCMAMLSGCSARCTVLTAQTLFSLRSRARVRPSTKPTPQGFLSQNCS